jgi:DNA-binding NarL/FixJ family response regulator
MDPRAVRPPPPPAGTGLAAGGSCCSLTISGLPDSGDGVIIRIKDMAGEDAAKYYLALVDDHSLIRQGIRNIIAACRELEVLGEFSDGQEFLDSLEEKVPHLAILDVSRPRMGGLEVALKAKARQPQLKILILAPERNREYLVAALAAGAAGCLLKDHIDTELLAAIAAIRQGGSYISRIFGANGTRLANSGPEAALSTAGAGA